MGEELLFHVEESSFRAINLQETQIPYQSLGNILIIVQDILWIHYLNVSNVCSENIKLASFLSLEKYKTRNNANKNILLAIVNVLTIY